MYIFSILLVYKNIISLSWSFYSVVGSPETKKDQKFDCKTCNKRYSSVKSLRQHAKVHDESNPHKCTVCMKIFPYKSGLERHYTKHTKPHICSTCDKRFAQKRSLIKHQAAHSVEGTHKCLLCPSERLFNTKRALQSHMIYHSEPKYLCGKCGKKYYNSSGLRRHEKIHERKFMTPWNNLLFSFFISIQFVFF